MRDEVEEIVYKSKLDPVGLLNSIDILPIEAVEAMKPFVMVIIFTH